MSAKLHDEKPTGRPREYPKEAAKPNGRPSKNDARKPWAEWYIDKRLGYWYPTIEVHDGYWVRIQLKDLGFWWDKGKKLWVWKHRMINEYESNLFIDSMKDRLTAIGVKI